MMNYLIYQYLLLKILP